ncbi:LIC12162 family transferase [Candidatus Nucleicultrix amoebiphila]|jgi:putative transferase (TIGR04331 family)|uniref:Transferase n=1 Tax=Candidatus Nucleicultrix amoebiphila FS5 TaxID=1414854 RepID=A0A1W6N5J2_9PROT|nr:LIC12162 family protein [Candidatus Nucleicultrix amoebiphila]ARN85052.1 hypothetical protein GQ61_06845 [Candidatus Nucleicultrix amoebiphila FS5]
MQKKLVIGTASSERTQKNLVIPFVSSKLTDGKLLVKDLNNLLCPKIFSDISEKDKVYQNLDSLIEYFVVKHTKKLKKTTKDHLSDDFYNFLLRPYFNYIICSVFSKFQILKNVIDSSKESLAVEALDVNLGERFINFQHFHLNFHFNQNFHMWISSVILNFLKNDRVKIKTIGSFHPQPFLNKKRSIWNEIIKYKMFTKPHRFFFLFSNLLNDKFNKHLLFKKVYGIGFFISLVFSSILLLKRRRHFVEQKSAKVHKKNFNLDNWDPNFINSLEHIIMQTLPYSFNEGFNDYLSKEKNTKTRKARIIFDKSTMQDEFLIKQALSKENGRLVFVQHGAGYCTHNEYRLLSYEFNSDMFIIWGKQAPNKGQCEFISLPSPLLSKMKNKHRFKTDTLVFGGTCINPLWDGVLYPDPSHLRGYLAQKVDFFNSIDTRLIKKSFYKAHPAGENDTVFFNEVFFIKNSLPELQIIPSNMNFEKYLLSCRLLILDHYGTAFYKAMASNTPTILYFGFPFFDFLPEFKNLLNEFHECGVFVTSAKDAAIKANDLWDNVEEWWLSSKVQNTRNKFCKLYAQTDSFYLFKWANAIFKL